MSGGLVHAIMISVVGPKGIWKTRQISKPEFDGGRAAMTVDVYKLFEDLENLSQVEAIALAGSRATGRSDEKSDYDVYVYITDRIAEVGYLN